MESPSGRQFIRKSAASESHLPVDGGAMEEGPIPVREDEGLCWVHSLFETFPLEHGKVGRTDVHHFSVFNILTCDVCTHSCCLD